MSNTAKYKNKLYNAFKLGGLLVRREFCSLIIDKLLEARRPLDDSKEFENCIKLLCDSLEQQCSSDQSIEKDHIQNAIEACLHSGYDSNETVFSIVNAFDFPKLVYDPDRKLYISAKTKSQLLASPDVKAQLFIDRYTTILQRTRRNFSQKLATNEQNKLKLQTVDYLLTVSHETLDRTLILGSLLQVSEGKWYLEDPTGIVQLDLTHAKYYGGFFTENCFVLLNGYYEDKIMHVSSITLPPGEEYSDSRPSFGNLNYFGGNSTSALRESPRLNEYMKRNPHNMIMFFSDVWLDHPLIFEKLEVLFNGLQNTPPVAFVFMGNFMSESHGSEMMEMLKRLFKQLGELISRFQMIMGTSKFVFVPGMVDPCTPHTLPRLPLPTHITDEMKKNIPNAIFATNPCRLQYCTKEITLFRSDVQAKFLQGTIHKPNKEDISECVTRTLLSQGHLSPFSLNALPVHWDFDYTLRLYPLPDVVVVGDRSEAYQGYYKGCHVVNPGSFCENEFQFVSYMPFTNTVDSCAL